MIITCEACGTSFKIKSSLIKDTGSSVKCSKCQQVFIAYPPYVKPEAPTELVSEADGSDDDEAFEKALDKAFEDDFEDDFESGSTEQEEIESEIDEAIGAIDDEFSDLGAEIDVDEIDLSSDETDDDLMDETEALFEKLEEDAFTTQEIIISDLEAAGDVQEVMMSDLEGGGGGR